MTALVDILEAAKREQLAKELRDAGYAVTEDFKDGHERYDLVASKDGKRIAIEVKARAVLRDDTPEILRHREQALRAGYAEYRLIVVNPPRERKIEVDGLKAALFAHLTRQPQPKLDHLASRISIDRVGVTDINAIEVTADGVHVVGTGMVEATLDYDAPDPDLGVGMESDFPLSFDVILDHQLQIKEARTLELDVSDYYE